VQRGAPKTAASSCQDSEIRRAHGATCYGTYKYWNIILILILILILIP